MESFWHIDSLHNTLYTFMLLSLEYAPCVLDRLIDNRHRGEYILLRVLCKYLNT
jgi:hypothetical protein